MTNALSIRVAVASEHKALEALQVRASLSNANDREALLANPDAIALPLEQIASGQVFVAERDGAIVGFAAVLPRAAFAGTAWPECARGPLGGRSPRASSC